MSKGLAELTLVLVFRPTEALVAQPCRLPRLRWLGLRHVRRCGLEPLRGHAGPTHLHADWLQAHEDPAFLDGVPCLRDLWLGRMTSVRLETLASLPELEALRIAGPISSAIRVPTPRRDGRRARIDRASAPQPGMIPPRASRNSTKARASSSGNANRAGTAAQ